MALVAPIVNSIVAPINISKVDEVEMPIPIEELVSFSYEDIVEACKQMGLVEELRCVIKTQTNSQCLMIATKKNKDGYPCCSGASHMSSSAKDVFPDPVRGHFIFAREAEQKAQRVQPHDQSMDAPKPRCHAQSAKSGNRCGLPIEKGDFCNFHQNSTNLYKDDDVIVLCGVRTSTGTPCRNVRVAGKDACTKHISKPQTEHVHAHVDSSSTDSESEHGLPASIPISSTPSIPSSTPSSTSTGMCHAVTKEGTNCSRKGKENHGGFLYCTQHWKMVSKA